MPAKRKSVLYGPVPDVLSLPKVSATRDKVAGRLVVHAADEIHVFAIICGEVLVTGSHSYKTHADALAAGREWAARLGITLEE